ncbi:MAG: histidinol dehydrogenase [Schleiferiaceae bacterium]|nr:histidinol dehydrogenase [Schleiferiaceae bacterium]
MTILKYPTNSELQAALQRSNWDYRALEPMISEIFDDVKRNGEEALIRYTKHFDKVTVASITRPLDEEVVLEVNLMQAIDTAFEAIKSFHESQRTIPQPIVTTPGVSCWQRETPIARVGLYVPGGSAPLFSTVLMLAIPAMVAGCKEIVMATPPQRDGSVHPAIVYAAKKCGVTSILTLGGAQAIAAMVFGTDYTPACYKIFGPGNTFVTAAKIYAQTLGIAIDMPAGPSEVLIIADAFANPDFVAADLIAQAEHGADSQVVLLTDSPELCDAVAVALKEQLMNLPRAPIASKALATSCLVVLPSLMACVEGSNYYAPEHLILSVEDPNTLLNAIENAGTIFIGKYGCESLGDYATGANHTLPTAGFAKAYSGVSLSSFCKTITIQNVTQEGLRNLGPTIVTLANAEGLAGHANAVRVRLEELKNK